MPSDLAGERARILSAYAARRARVAAGDVDPLRYTSWTPGYLFSHQLLERRVLRLLAERGLRPLTGKKILDVGCGDGAIGESEGIHLLDFVRYGARPADLHGVDLQPQLVERGRKLLPAAELLVGSVDALPYEDGTFDVVAQSTVFSSILDDEMRRRGAAEMLRVLAPGGTILWYDFRVGNPRNPDLRPVPRSELRALFPGCRLRVEPATLAHPLARAVAPRSWLAAYLLERVRPARTHLLAAVEGARA